MQMVSSELRKHLRFVCAVVAGPEEIFFRAEVTSRETAFSQCCDALGGFFSSDLHIASEQRNI